jgi:hypothetical protein
MMVPQRLTVTFGAAPCTAIARSIAVDLLANRWCKQRPVGGVTGMFDRRAIKK